MKQKRWNSIDVLRVCSFLLILIYHYMVEIEAGGFLALTDMGITYETSNLHMAKIGVTLFFMLSGFGLMYSSFSGFTLKDYAKKRFVRILIPYYTVSLLVFLAGKILTPGSLYEQPVPGWHIIFTLLGLDGYLKEYGILTFHLGVGEWFIGCLILMYLVFPLLKKGMDRNSDITTAVAAGCFLIVAAAYQGTVPSHYFFPIKLFDFILGMYLAVRLKKPSWKYAAVSGMAAVVLLIVPWDIPVNKNYLNVIFCTLLFFCVFHMEEQKWLGRISGCRAVRVVSRYSYEMFLIHHWAIIIMNRILKPASAGSAVLCLLLEGAVILTGSALINKILGMMEKKFIGK